MFHCFVSFSLYSYVVLFSISFQITLVNKAIIDLKKPCKNNTTEKAKTLLIR